MKFILGFVQHRGYKDQYVQELNSSYCFDDESTLTNLVCIKVINVVKQT